MSNGETIYDDTCAWCKHTLKVYVLSWQTVKSRDSMPLVANYCDEKTCRDPDQIKECKHTCEETALSTPENIESMLLEVMRRRRKIERLEKEAEEAIKAARAK